jgi:hypothetical protein
MARWFVVAALPILCAIPGDDHPSIDNGRMLAPAAFLRFKAQDYVELKDSIGLVQLDGSFTIEMWTRWSPYEPSGMNLIGDEAWPGMSADVKVDAESGWVLRTSTVEKGDWRRLDFTLAVMVNKKPTWKRTITEPRRCIEASGWHHVAVCKNAGNVYLFWNGNLAAKDSVRELQLTPCATPLYIGVRKSAFGNRSFFGDVRAFRISNKARYSKDFAPTEVFEKDEGTVCLLDFSKVKDEVVPDASGKGHDGKIVGASLIQVKD